MEIGETVLNWLLSNWVFGSIIFLVLALIRAMRERAQSDVSSLGGFIAGGLLFHPMRLIRGQASLYLTAFDYAKRHLERPELKFLQVPARDDVKLETDQVFVPLIMEDMGKPYDHNTVFRVGNRFRIVGDPGSGKSTIVKRLCRDQCKLLAKWRTARSGRVPIVVELRNLKPPLEPDGDPGEWLLRRIEEEATRFTAYDMKSCVNSFMEGRGMLVLFDGADEIAAEHYEAIEVALNAISERLAAKSSENIVVITMRSQFHLQVRDRFAKQFPTVLHVKPFTPGDIYALLNKWPFSKNRAEHAAQIYADLSDRPSLRELCYNPLVLSMYIAEDQRRVRDFGDRAHNVQVPDSRTEFYKDVVEELLLKRRETQIGQRTGGRVRVTVQRTRQQFFGQLAYNHLLGNDQAANTIPFDNALALAKTIFKVDHSDPDIEKDEVQKLVRDLSKQTGLFTEEREGEQIRFIHLSFVEYFAALHAIKRVEGGWKEILTRHQANQHACEPSLRTRLREVFPFAVHLAHEREQPSYLADVCRCLQDDQLKASCFLETKAYETESSREFAAQLPDALSSLLPRLQNDDDAQKFYTFVAALRDAETQGYKSGNGVEDGLDNILRTILQDDEVRAFRAIDLMARYDAVAALRLAELCQLPLLKKYPKFLIINCEQPAFLGQVIQRALARDGDQDAWLVYAGIAGLWVPAARAELLAKEPVRELKPSEPRVERLWARLLDRKEKNLLTQVLSRFPKLEYDAPYLRTLLPYLILMFGKRCLSPKYLSNARIRTRIRQFFITLIFRFPIALIFITFIVLIYIIFIMALDFYEMINIEPANSTSNINFEYFPYTTIIVIFGIFYVMMFKFILNITYLELPSSFSYETHRKEAPWFISLLVVIFNRFNWWKSSLVFIHSIKRGQIVYFANTASYCRKNNCYVGSKFRHKEIRNILIFERLVNLLRR